MRKVRTLIGMPVVCDDRRIGRVLAADLAEDLRQLQGIWVGRGLTGTRYISSENLEMLGRVAVMADSAGTRRRSHAERLFRRAISTDGQRLGAIIDAEVDELSFRVVALELSAGLWDDLLHPRQRVTRYAVNRESGVVVIDPAGEETEASANENRSVEGPFDGHADRRLGGDHFRRDELADGEKVEPEGEADGKLDL